VGVIGQTKRYAPAGNGLVGTVAAGALAGGFVSSGVGAALAFYRGGVLDGVGWNLALLGYSTSVGLVAGALCGLLIGIPLFALLLLWPSSSLLRRVGELVTLLAITFLTVRGLLSGASYPEPPSWTPVGLGLLALTSGLLWFAGGEPFRRRWERLAPIAIGVAALAVAGPAIFVRSVPRMTGAIAPKPAAAPGAVSPRLHRASVELPAGESTPPFPRARNLLLIVIDTLRADHLSCYGYARATSPRIDQLAIEGIRFERSLAQKGRTSPSVATILSGTYPHTHGLLDIRSVLPDGVLTLAEILGPRGWRTAGMITNANLSHIFNFQQGFDDYVELGNADLHATADTLTNEAIPWLEEHRGEPFFLYLHYVDPHAPYIPPDAYKDRFAGDALYGRYRHLKPPLGSNSMGAIDPHAVIENGSRDVDLYVARYDAEIAFTDAEVGRVLDAVDALGLREDTLVVLTADHGESMAENYVFFAHGKTPYDNSLRVPLIVRYPPAVGSPRVVETAVETTDIAPTVIAALGLPRSPTFEGKNLWPLMLGAEGSPSRRVFAEEGATLRKLARVVSDERHKLIYNPTGVDLPRTAFQPATLLTRKGLRRLWWAAHDGPGAHELWEYYDLQADPGETRNLYRRRPKVVASLQEDLARWTASAPPDRSPNRLALEDISIDQLKQLEALGYVK